MRKLQKQLSDVFYQFGKDIGGIEQRLSSIETALQSNGVQHQSEDLSELETELQFLQEQNNLLQTEKARLTSEMKKVLPTELENKMLAQTATLHFRVHFNPKKSANGFQMVERLPMIDYFPEIRPNQNVMIVVRQENNNSAGMSPLGTLHTIYRIDGANTFGKTADIYVFIDGEEKRPMVELTFG